ncbi:MAG: ABC transporter substrate-binding protein [Prevotellaceae bacterium]|jgi:iron complex transport system substrate-binding protein|nr:ABC transporter substrate-binding protein [Prevotellaceae bacterium]
MANTPFFKIAVLFTAAFCAWTCEHRIPDGKVQGNFYTPRYAGGFCIDTSGGAKTLTVINPFQSSKDLAYRYTLSDTPPKRVICMSTTHAAFLRFIGQAERIVGVSGAGNLYDSLMRAACSAGAISDVGYDNTLNMEKILALQPDVIFAYGIAGEFSATAAKLQELGLKVMYIGEYTESHPLGKAEWAVAFAALFGCDPQAIEKFAQVAAAYEALKADVAAADVPKTKTLLNAPWSDAWFVPGALGNAAQLLSDAGGESVITLRSQRDSYPISIEQAYSSAQAAEVWLNTGQARTLSELRAMHKLVENIPAFRRGNVYNSTARMTPQGGSDFFESGTVNPHLILKDVIKILHPDLLSGDTLTYYHLLRDDLKAQ